VKSTRKELLLSTVAAVLTTLELTSCTNLRRETYSRNHGKTVEGWPQQVNQIKYTSSADSTTQPALFYAPKTKPCTALVQGEPTPLLVALHTWSGNYLQKMSVPYAQWCIEKPWVFIHPNFRGPNRKPQATGPAPETVQGHADDIAKSCDGSPGTSTALDLEYKKRSPVTYLSEAVNLPPRY